MATGRVRTVSVRVTADVSDLDKKLRSVQKTLKKTGKKFKDVGAGISKAFTVPVLAAGAAAFKFIQDASDMGETQSKIGELFDQSAGKIDNWSNSAAKAFGQSKQQAMDAAATFAIFGKSAGLGGDDLVGFSTELTELASDLASFNNTSPEEAINAIGSALRGEAEPMRRFGVLLDDASLRNEALKMGLIETTKDALTPQQKVLSAHALILAQTTTAQGDFARTSGGLANQQRILAAQFKDTSAELGEALLPLAMELMTVFRESVMPAIQGVVEWFKKLSPQTIKIAAIIGLVLAVVGPLIIGLGFVISSISTLIPVLAALTGPVGLVIVSIVALVAGITYLWKTNETFREAVIAIWDGIVKYYTWAFGVIKDIAMVIFNGLKDFWDKWGATITQSFKDYLEILKIIYDTAFKVIYEGIKIVFDQIKIFWDNWGGAITLMFKTTFENLKVFFQFTWDTIKNIIETAIKIISSIISLILNIIKGDWSGAWEDIKKIGTTVWDFITRQVEIFGDYFVGIFQNVKDNILKIFKGILDGVLGTVKNVIDSVSKALDKINIFNRTKPETKTFTTINETINRVKSAVGSVIPHAEGGIFTQPTLIGNHLFGEAGAEALIPLDKLGGMMKDNGRSSTPINIYLDGKMIAEVTAPHMVKTIRQKTGFVF